MAIDFSQVTDITIPETASSVPTTVTGTFPLSIVSPYTGQFSSVSISGNSVQDGTPTPSSPVDVCGVGDKTENLFDAQNYTYYGATASADGTITATDTSFGILFTPSQMKSIFSRTGKYYLSKLYTVGSSASTDWRIYIGWDSSKQIRFGNGVATITEELLGYINSATSNSRMYTYGTAGTNPVLKLMITTDSFHDTYIPYGYKVPIEVSDGTNTTTYTTYISTPLQKIGTYKDTIDSDGTLIRKTKSYVMTGTESSFIDQIVGNNRCFFNPPSILNTGSISTPDCMSTIGVGNSDGTTANTSFIYGGRFYFVFDNGITFPTLADFTNYLAAQYAAGTPVTIYYPLATPTTESITPLTINAGQGTNIVDVTTTVEPSEGTLTIPAQTVESIAINGTTIWEKS